MTTLRCAIYTRKSSEEGLGMDFNSLDAQREACEAYITSQKHEGWQLVKEHYDDGGFSGGNTDRPGLQKLLKDIDDRKVNVIVVYKVDRLTRSLADFAKLVERFDKHGVFFVSVTQQFNTTSSMGRLTLNVLLSFAQFEREVTGERIRDKIAASKKKGIWMGGNVPLGYRVDKRNLLVVPEDAERVRHLFRRYLELGNVRLLQDEITANNVRSKRGKIISRGNLFNMLSNPIYIGQISHKGVCNPGQHDAIIGPELWEEVQQHLTGNRKGNKGKVAKSEPCPLARKLFDASGERLVPVHARKEERRYRYYILESLVLRPAAESPDGWRLPGAEIENIVAQAAIRMLQDQEGLTSALREHGIEVHNFSAVLARGKIFCQRLSSDAERPEALAALVRRVDLRRDGLTVTLLLSPLIEQLGQETDIVMIRETAMRMRRRGVETKLIMMDGNASRTDPVLINAVARARLWFDELIEGKVRSIREISKRDKISESHIGNLLPLAFLAPDIIEAILAGCQPPALTMEALTKYIRLPLDWESQRLIMKT